MLGYFIHFLAVAPVWSAREQYLSLYVSVIYFILRYKLDKCIVMVNVGQENKLESHFSTFYISR